jgi:hypothetical protein
MKEPNLDKVYTLVYSLEILGESEVMIYGESPAELYKIEDQKLLSTKFNLIVNKYPETGCHVETITIEKPKYWYCLPGMSVENKDRSKIKKLERFNELYELYVTGAQSFENNNLHLQELIFLYCGGLKDDLTSDQHSWALENLPFTQGC